MVETHDEKSRRSSPKSSSRGGITSKSHSPKRKNTKEHRPRRTKRSHQEKLQAAKELDIPDNNGVVVLESVEGRDRNKHRSSKRRSSQQQDRGGIDNNKDGVTKKKTLIKQGPAPGVHADSRGDNVGIHQRSKGRLSRPLGKEEERARLGAGKEKEQQGEALVVARVVDENEDAQLTMALLQMDRCASNKGREAKNTTQNKSMDGTKIFSNRENQQWEDNNESNWEQSKLRKGARIFRYLLCVAVFVGAGIATWFALRRNAAISDSNREPSSWESFSNVTTVDTGRITPSNSNIGTDVTFEPPSAEDCAAITTGSEIEGQNTMPVQSYQLDLDATSLLPMDPSFSASIIQDKLRELLAPALTGCSITGDVPNLRRQRHLNDGDDLSSYAIGNVMVDTFEVEGLGCLDDSNNPKCNRVRVSIDVAVKDETVKAAFVIGELSRFLGGGPLAEKLELTNTYISVVVVILGPTNPIEAPSISNILPSVEPSREQIETQGGTSKSVILPTEAPVASPTAASPTPEPTALPSPLPTLQPTLQPTSRPSPLPTKNPSPGPTTLPPTPEPTALPSPLPTLQPTLQPTARPSPLPTKNPSPSPTTLPPTPEPSALPSSLPTPQPTLQPTVRPSPLPTKNPTPWPSSLPTAGPTPSPSPNELYYCSTEQRNCQDISLEEVYIEMSNTEVIVMVTYCPYTRIDPVNFSWAFNIQVPLMNPAVGNAFFDVNFGPLVGAVVDYEINSFGSYCVGNRSCSGSIDEISVSSSTYSRTVSFSLLSIASQFDVSESGFQYYFDDGLARLVFPPGEPYHSLDPCT